ncbi:MAG: hypothetical protein J0I45_16240 [Bosea sp.]|nr:hypothetical protein [Bosea sp. (in: a-proteobacteria)]
MSIRIIQLPAVIGTPNPALVVAVDGDSTQKATLDQVGAAIADASPFFYGRIGLSPWIVTTNSVVAVTGQRFQCNTAGGAMTVALPGDPAEGNEVWTYNYGSNFLTISRNGSTIIGLPENVIVEVDDAELHFVFRNGTWTY